MQERGAAPPLSDGERPRARRPSPRCSSPPPLPSWWWPSTRPPSRGRCTACRSGPIHVMWKLDLQLTYNSGAAFSFAQGWAPVLGAVAVIAVLVLLGAVRRVQSTAMAVALGLVVGGALGNLADRVLRSNHGGGGRLHRAAFLADVQRGRLVHRGGGHRGRGAVVAYRTGPVTTPPGHPSRRAPLELADGRPRRARPRWRWSAGGPGGVAAERVAAPCRGGPGRGGRVCASTVGPSRRAAPRSTPDNGSRSTPTPRSPMSRCPIRRWPSPWCTKTPS